MVFIKLKYDKKVASKFKEYHINKFKLENFLNYHTNNLIATRKWWTYVIKVKGISGSGSQYFWNEDEIEVGLHAPVDSFNDTRLFYMESLVHECRHWVQCKLQNVKCRDLEYTEKDVQDITPQYMDCKYEMECREWESLVAKYEDQLK